MARLTQVWVAIQRMESHPHLEVINRPTLEDPYKADLRMIEMLKRSLDSTAMVKISQHSNLL